MNTKFNQTLIETKNSFSYDVSRKQTKMYCKNKSIERFNHITGQSNNTDIHGLLWDDRVILEVTSIDLDSRRCFVKNTNNGLEWLTEISNITFCDENGKYRSILNN
jgi:translation initiation factor IF-1